METMLYLKPREGLTVRDPRTTKPVPAYGAEVSNASYWRRRRKDGDMETTTAAAIQKGAAAAAKAAATAETTEEG